MPENAMRVFGKLSREAQHLWPGSWVVQYDGDVVLERPDSDDVILGADLKDAEEALKVLSEIEPRR